MIKSLFKYKRIRNAAKGIGALYLLVSILSLAAMSTVPIVIAFFFTLVAIAFAVIIYIGVNLFEFMDGDKDEK